MFSGPVQETVITVVLKFTLASGNITFESFNGIPNYFRIGCGEHISFVSILHISFVCTSNMNSLVYNEKPWVNGLNSSISNKEVLPYGYDVYRTDRALGRSGG